MAEYRVLIPLDGSRTAEHALSYIGTLTALGESRVRLVSVVDESEDFHAMAPDEARERETNILTKYLHDIASDVQEHVGIEVETKVVRGNPAARLVSEASEFKPDLFVISTHGRTGPSRWRLGSVADKVIRGGDCNTLVVGPHATANETWMEARIMPPFRAVMVPLDGSELAEQALDVARTIVETFDAKLHLVRAVPIPTYVDGSGADTVYYPQIIDSLEDAAKTYLAEVAGRFAALEPVTFSSLGTPSVQLEQYATTHSIDLIVMTTHGRGGLLRSALGSVTDRLVGGPAPVLVVRARGQ